MIKLQNVDHETIRESNRKSILNLLYREKQLTKQDISRETKISIPTVGSVINELIEEGIVIEAGVAGSTGGRKPVIVRFVEDSRYSFGVEIRPDNIRIILTNLISDIKYSESMPIDDISEFDSIIHNVNKIINRIIEDFKIEKNKITGLGFSLPGIVDDENLILKVAPNMELCDIDFKKYKDIFKMPIYIENEANLAAYAELNIGIAKKMRNLIYVSITEGIGTGIVIQDYLYKGKNKIAGEFGHMTIVKDGKRCNCGRYGCFEQYASVKALIELYKSYSNKKINIKDFNLLLKNNDELAIKIFDEYTDYLASGLQNMIMILDPHYIIIGGDVVEFEDVLIDSLIKKVFQKNNFYNENSTKIFLSRLKENASILGASLLPFENLFNINKKII
ncbi:Sugar kinase of the NBD/HSP70 family, may contain an N-terminal HTH domain [Caloramator quimbayensis]|uniref:Sugar kinase of the NBD/HSP70 family, may contain an N-terminal HTH domain n=1 Tax=Caloramator quimbayensis TaxID=1147123 RepID=A0A1T4WWJ6_9CLOT|nr:ROK family transcriptional regulator [Caloramator quimbayensis]SKA81619.1 Sugar kinase of the NBD/HSP70 family, may contain an N-terminal HTH domain [Caloramator quimbayensis]